MRLSVEWLRCAADCDHALWEQSFPAHLEGKWWYETLERSGLEDQFSFYYLQLRNPQNKAIALAPCFVMDVPLEMFAPEPLVPVLRFIARFYPPLLHQRTFFVGSPCSDQGWIGLDSNLNEEDIAHILSQIQRAIIEKAEDMHAPMRVWKDMPARFWPALDTISKKHKLFKVVSFPGTQVALPQDPVEGKRTKEAYLLTMKPSRRTRLRRTLKGAKQKNHLRVRVFDTLTPERCEQVFGLFMQTYTQSETQFERLNPSFFEVIAKVECTRFILLYPEEQDLQETSASEGTDFNPEEPVAFMLVFCNGTILVNKFIGINYAVPRNWYVYFQLWDAAVDYAIEHGFEAIESGQTGYGAKISMGHAMIPLYNYCHHANPLLRWVYAQVGKHITWESLDPELGRSRIERDD